MFSEHVVPMDNKTSMADEAVRENVFQVAVRFRPLNEREKRAIRAMREDDEDDYEDGLLHVYSDTTFTFDEKAYTFDRVFDERVDQVELYCTMVRPLIERFVEQSHDVTIIAYGQTSSGKTHTIDGDTTHGLSAQAGIVPRTIFDVFALAANRYTVEFSFYEIYCEKIVDLLAATRQNGGDPEEVMLFDDRSTGKVFMRNLVWERCETAEQLLQRLNETRAKRHYAYTEMNANSSRSHTILDLRLTLAGGGRRGKAVTPDYKNCRVVDLAGSERAARTKAVGITFEEGKKINQSLMDLRTIISQLSRASSSSSTTTNHRASKLTRILYGSFKGRSRVIVLICCSPALDSRSETAGSLRFGCHAKRIRLKLDDVKAKTIEPINQSPDAMAKAEAARADMEKRLERMLAEAENREQKINEYETEMESLRLLLQRIQNEPTGGIALPATTQPSLRTQSVQVNMPCPLSVTAAEPLVPAAAPLRDEFSSAGERYLVLLEKERRRNIRYRATIEDLRHVLDDKMHDNEQLEHELQAMRTLKNMLLREL
jgi:kinesin family member 5